MSSRRLKEARDHQKPHSEEAPVLDLTVDKESRAFKIVQDAYTTGTRLDLTNMTDQELAEYVAGQA